MTKTFEDDLREKLRDLEFAKAFGAAQAKSSFALTLAKARKNLGLTQKELANKAGVTQAYIAKLEGGEANPTLERIGSLLAMFGLGLATDATTLSPYPETIHWEIYWPSEAWLMPPPVEFIQFATDATQREEVLVL